MRSANAVEEAVRDRLVHVDPLDRDADLAGRREAALDGAIDRRVQIGIRQHDHRVLAAEFERAADQAFRRLPRHQPAGARAAREHDVIRRALRAPARAAARPRDDAEDVRRKACLAQQVHRPQRREAGLYIRFENRRVAGHQCRHRVRHRQVQRIVPRDNQADHTDRRFEFAGPGEQGKGALAPPRPQQALGAPRVIARDDGGIQNLFECVPPRLAGLPLDEIEHFILALEQQVVKAQKDARAIGKRARAPRRLGRRVRASRRVPDPRRFRPGWRRWRRPCRARARQWSHEARRARVICASKRSSSEAERRNQPGRLGRIRCLRVRLLENST